MMPTISVNAMEKGNIQLLRLREISIRFPLLLDPKPEKNYSNRTIPWQPSSVMFAACVRLLRIVV
jgi:hypothetical protein